MALREYTWGKEEIGVCDQLKTQAENLKESRVGFKESLILGSHGEDTADNQKQTWFQEFKL